MLLCFTRKTNWSWRLPHHKSWQYRVYNSRANVTRSTKLKRVGLNCYKLEWIIFFGRHWPTTTILYGVMQPYALWKYLRIMIDQMSRLMMMLPTFDALVNSIQLCSSIWIKKHGRCQFLGSNGGSCFTVRDLQPWLKQWGINILGTLIYNHKSTGLIDWAKISVVWLIGVACCDGRRGDECWQHIPFVNLVYNT